MNRSRRTVLAQLFGGLTLGLLVRPAAAQRAVGDKIPKTAVDFQTTPKGNERCGSCANFLAENNACRLVAGDIRADNWCKMWIQALD